MTPHNAQSFSRSLLPSGPEDLRVLLVDDDPAARRAVQSLLAVAGIVVVGTVADGATALALAGLAAPSVVVADLRVRRSGTFGLLTFLHRLGQMDPTIEVVVHTGAMDPAFARAVYLSGAFAVVLKGAAGDKLLWTINAAHVARRAERRQGYRPGAPRADAL